jgi:RNA polymerase sigma-70 factor, ECF subfamily
MGSEPVSRSGVGVTEDEVPVMGVSIRHLEDGTQAPESRPYESELFAFACNLVADRTEARHLLDETYMRMPPQGIAGRPLEIRSFKQAVQEIVMERYHDFHWQLVWEEVGPKWHRDDYTVKQKRVLERLEDEPTALQQALSRLPFIYRSVLVLHDVEGWTIRDLAAAQDLTESLAMERICRARMMIVTSLAAGAERSIPYRRKGGSQCPEIRRDFTAYLHGSLKSKARVSVERHLRHCPTCPPLYAAVLATRDKLASLGEESAAS